MGRCHYRSYLVNPRYFVEPVDDAYPVSFVPMAAVEAKSGRIDLNQVRAYQDVSKGYTRFSEGDLLFAKIAPCMENGKVAIARGHTNVRIKVDPIIKTARGLN